MNKDRRLHSFFYVATILSLLLCTATIAVGQKGSENSKPTATNDQNASGPQILFDDVRTTTFKSREACSLLKTDILMQKRFLKATSTRWRRTRTFRLLCCSRRSTNSGTAHAARTPRSSPKREPKMNDRFVGYRLYFSHREMVKGVQRRPAIGGHIRSCFKHVARISASRYRYS